MLIWMKFFRSFSKFHFGVNKNSKISLCIELTKNLDQTKTKSLRFVLVSMEIYLKSFFSLIHELVFDSKAKQFKRSKRMPSNSERFFLFNLDS